MVAVAVAVVVDGGIGRVADAPFNVLRHGTGLAVGPSAGGAQRQVVFAKRDLRLAAAFDGDVYGVRAYADGDLAGCLQAIVGSGGDGGHALADAGDDAVFVDGGDVFIVALQAKSEGV